MAPSNSVKVTLTRTRAHSILARRSDFFPGIGKRQTHHSAPGQEILLSTIKEQDKMIAQLAKNMGNVLKHTSKPPLPGEMSDKAFNLVHRTHYLIMKQKCVAANESKLVETAVRLHHDSEMARARMRYGTCAVGIIAGTCAVGIIAGTVAWQTTACNRYVAKDSGANKPT